MSLRFRGRGQKSPLEETNRGCWDGLQDAVIAAVAPLHQAVVLPLGLDCNTTTLLELAILITQNSLSSLCLFVEIEERYLSISI